MKRLKEQERDRDSKQTNDKTEEEESYTNSALKKTKKVDQKCCIRNRRKQTKIDFHKAAKGKKTSINI